ncbi:MAG: hypothetical protein QXO33_05785 [Nitrososphaeria archaeon]
MGKIVSKEIELSKYQEREVYGIKILLDIDEETALKLYLRYGGFKSAIYGYFKEHPLEIFNMKKED